MLPCVCLQAQSATLTIAQAFNLAYSYWLAAHERKRRRDKERRSDRRLGLIAKLEKLFSKVSREGKYLFMGNNSKFCEKFSSN